ncbi:MAG: ABC transporter permease [Cyclobacteriaceae bacterium]
MLKSYLKIAYRNLLKNKVFSLINMLGLAIGMAACLLILQYVRFELSYDDFHVNAPQLYRVGADYHDGALRETTLTPPPLGPILQESYPEVINFTRLILPWSGQSRTSTLSWQEAGGKTVKQSLRWGFFTDPGFLEMFTFPLVRGNPRDALTGTHKIILSESTARKLFGNDWHKNTQIIGQTVEYINEFDRFSLVISGIIADAPANAHFQYDFLASFATLSTGWAKGYAETWGGNGVYTYLQLAPEADIPTFYPRISEAVATHRPEAFQENIDFVLQPLSDIYLHSHREDELKVNGNAVYVYFFSIIGVLILLIALVNYINLTIAKAMTRGSEIGIRKVMGAQRLQLIRQFLFESLLLNSIALVLAMTIIQLVSAFYAQFTGKGLPDSGEVFWEAALLLFLISTLLAGSYPALLLSRSNLLPILKGRWTNQFRGKQLRQGMVVFQFSVSIMLIIFTAAVIQQVHHMRSNDPGFNREGVIVVKGPEDRTETWIEHDQQQSNKRKARKEILLKRLCYPTSGFGRFRSQGRSQANEAVSGR